MTIDEAIQHCKDVIREKNEELSEIGSYLPNKLADDNEIEDCIKCKEEHEQLKEWLEEYKVLKEKATPKPVVLEDDGFYCPSCKLRLETKLFDSVYCHYCGQRLE